MITAGAAILNTTVLGYYEVSIEYRCDKFMDGKVTMREKTSVWEWDSV